MSCRFNYTFVFWVTIIRDIEQNKYSVALCSNLEHTVGQLAPHEWLMYLRFFTDMHEAVGHKLFLESLDTKSLRRNIRLMNRRELNLHALFRQYMELGREGEPEENLKPKEQSISF